MKVKEIFATIQGEGLYSGAVTTFIRFAGCSLRCEHCDTKYSWLAEGDDIGVPVILERVTEVHPHPRHICITGGEPFEQPQNEMFALIHALLDWQGARGLESIVIETNGAQDVNWVLDKPFRSLTHLSVDFKLPSSGRQDKMLVDNFKYLGPRDVIKFICEGDEDVEYAKKVLMRIKNFVSCYPVVLFHSLGGTPESWLPRRVLGFDLELHRRFDMRLGLQLHKLWDMK